MVKSEEEKTAPSMQDSQIPETSHGQDGVMPPPNPAASEVKSPIRCRGMVPGFLGGVAGAVLVLLLYGAGLLPAFFDRQDEAAIQERAHLLSMSLATTDKLQEAIDKIETADNKLQEAGNKATEALTLTSDLDDKTERLSAQIATIAQTMTTLDTQWANARRNDEAALSSLENQIATLEQASAALEEELQTQKNLMEGQSAALAAATATGNHDDGGLGLRMASNEARLDATIQGLMDLEKTVQAQQKLMESQNTAIASTAVTGDQDAAGLGSKLGLIEQKIAALSQTMRELEGTVNALDMELRAQRDALKDQKNDLDREARSSAQMQTSLEQTQTSLEQLQAALTQQRTIIQSLNETLETLPAITQQAADNQNMARLIAANALKAAVDRGGSYKNELQIFTSVAPEGLSLEILERAAESGLPNAASLSANFAAVADQIAATGHDLAPDASWNERITHEMKELYTQRPVGEVEGSDAPAIAARMEVAIAQGDYARALQEWATLPEAAQSVSADFVAQLKARQAVDELLSQLVALVLGQKE